MFIYAQIIDDSKGVTLVTASSRESDISGKKGPAKNLASAKQVGLLVAKRAKDKKVSQVVFDKGGYLYHGKIKALADAAREGGLIF